MDELHITLEEFLGAFFDPHEKVHFQILDDRGNSAFSEMQLEKDKGHVAAIEEKLRQHNERNRGIFFVVNLGGFKDEDIKRVNAHFVDIDSGTREEQESRITAFALPPSLIVRTARGYHCYWLMHNARLERFRYVQRQLVKQFDGDPACVNKNRVLRVPGFNHCKGEPTPVLCVKFNPELRYTQKELEEALPVVAEDVEPGAPAAAPIRERGMQKGLKLVAPCQFMKYCKRYAASLPEPLWYAMITNLALFEGGEDVIHKLSRPYPKYDARQTQAKIDHFLKSGTKPMTCAKIAELGFDCPKRRNGSCKCKSPAGLAFVPNALPELKRLLAKQKRSNDPATDLLTAKQFVTDYLFNVEPDVVRVFISHDIKAHFGFKKGDVADLPNYHRDLYRAHMEKLEVKRDRHGGELKPWYEIGERGGMIFLPSVLADWCAENEPVIYVSDSYYFYEHGVYLPKNEMAAERLIRHHMDNKRKTKAQIQDAEFQWRIEIDRDSREINPNPYLINCRNCMYNALTGEAQEHSPKLLSTMQLVGNYNPAAQCPTFMKYLSDVCSPDDIPLIQEMLGYMCIAVNKAQKCFVLVGKKDCGKSTMLYLIQDVLLGAANVSNLTWQDLNEKFAKFQLFGKLANVFADLPSEKITDTGTFKAVTGEDYITGQRKHKDVFSFKPFATMAFSANEVPKNYVDHSDAFYGRLVIIRFPNTIPKEKQDAYLKEKLKEEADGILAWALIGLRRLMENKWQFSETDSTRAELANYRSENSSALMFLDECCEIVPGAVELREEVYAAYLEYCNGNGQKSRLTKTGFNKELDGVVGIQRGQESVGHRKTWRGLRLL